MTHVMGWGGLLALSLVFNIHIMSLVNVSSPKIDFLAPEKLRIAFKSLAAPKSVSVQAQPEPAPEVQIVKEKQVLAVPEKITTPKIAKPQALPSVETVTHSSTKALLYKIDKKPETIAAVPTPRLLQKKELTVAKEIENPAEEMMSVVKIREPIKREPKATQPQRMASTPTTQSVADNRGTANATFIHKANYRERTPPRYPRRAYELGQQGSVLLHALVSKKGIARELKIETSSGYSLLDRAALSAVKNWEFIPHMRNGQKVQSWVRVPVNFVIQ
ncbi:MAG: energy transducer TonB [Sneathiella sp.]